MITQNYLSSFGEKRREMSFLLCFYFHFCFYGKYFLLFFFFFSRSKLDGLFDSWKTNMKNVINYHHQYSSTFAWLWWFLVICWLWGIRGCFYMIYCFSFFQTFFQVFHIFNFSHSIHLGTKQFDNSSSGDDVGIDYFRNSGESVSGQFWLGYSFPFFQ